MEEKIKLDTEMPEMMVVEKTEEPKVKKVKKVKKEIINENELINPLKNTKIRVKFIAKKSGIWGDNPKHVLAGGMSQAATRTFVVPVLSSGMYVNVLTDAEKQFFEWNFGLEPNALSIYRKTDNFWDCDNDDGINNVVLGKDDTYLDLSKPEDYIKYKILLANRDTIASSLKALEDTPRSTYQFVLIEENEEARASKSRMTLTMEAYKTFGTMENDVDKLIMIIETMTSKNIAPNTKIDFIHGKINDLIQQDTKMFLKIAKDEMLDNKVLIRKAVESGLIAKRGTFYYIKQDNNVTPMCEDGQEPNLNNAARWLVNPKRQEILFSLQAKLK